MKTLYLSNKITFYLDEIKLIFDFETGVKTINHFVKMVEKLSQSRKFVSNPKFPTNDELDKVNSFKGDMFEVLSEIFFIVYSADPAVGLREYQPVILSDDFGVDAVAINVNGDQCVVQCKYRSNPMDEITYGALAKTYAAGRELNHYSLDNNNTIFLFTCGSGANSNCHHVFGKKLRVINRSIISNYVDNNQTFWQTAESLILDTLEFLDKENK